MPQSGGTKAAKTEGKEPTKEIKRHAHLFFVGVTKIELPNVASNRERNMAGTIQGERSPISLNKEVNWERFNLKHSLIGFSFY